MVGQGLQPRRVVDICLPGGRGWQAEAMGVSTAAVGDALRQVGFTDANQQQLVSELSGGWRMRLAIAKAILENAELLMLVRAPLPHQGIRQRERACLQVLAIGQALAPPTAGPHTSRGQGGESAGRPSSLAPLGTRARQTVPCHLRVDVGPSWQNRAVLNG